jgi:hypothetical protein
VYQTSLGTIPVCCWIAFFYLGRKVISLEMHEIKTIHNFCATISNRLKKESFWVNQEMAHDKFYKDCHKIKSAGISIYSFLF